MSIVNFQLVKHPVNWITIILMVVFASIAGHLFLSYLGVEPASAQQSNQ